MSANTKVAKAKAPKARSALPKADAHNCVRCNQHPQEVRQVCSACDYVLQTMHRHQEYVLFRRTVYMFDDEPNSPKWYKDNGYADVLRKPPIPRFFKAHAPRPELSEPVLQ